ncbi:MAG: ABC transporter ATP-binding protein, partial [Oscillospiraceae bacterium]|nr:ABC transporter ATP-binding protein [Oscillospiraceae bacterium]
MKEYLPILIVGAIIGCVSLIFLIAFAAVKNKKEDMGFDRNMPDGEIIVRLLRYAKPHWKQFLLALIIMLFSIAYDVVSPLIIGHIEETIKERFEMSYLLILVAIYGSLLVVSMICTYAQAMILQKTGQKILSELREDIFTHIQSLS